jgi:chemotaxis protein MotB
MAEDHTKPIIIKKVRKGGHGHHGGAWKIAYADFVTAMMAFFLLMWLMGSTTQEEKQAISDYFQNPSPIAGPGGASTSMIKIGGGKDVTHSEGDTKRGSNAKDKVDATRPQAPEAAEVGKVTMDDKQRLLQLKQDLEQAIDASVALKPFKDQLLLEITKEGLRVQIIDKENRPMFASGSSRMQPYATQILREIGQVINQVPNKISLSGHTDATPFTKYSNNYTNWELSADRANASRRELLNGGMDQAKVARVVGLSSAVLFDKDNPTNPINRRISIIVLNKETEEAILHDEGKLEQTTSESLSPIAPAIPAVDPVMPSIAPGAPAIAPPPP